ncbi:regulator of Vps4 activity in the MVB pathway-domain-containing protein [Lactifluus subvellereus]|nr:regulator of Vps4 activity in the MVB pathway-domain-containing protein [Lactifluus subvellereus]
MSTWDQTRAKAQFRLTAQRLGQLRGRKDAQGQVIGRDISILLQQRNETLARAKAQRLMQDELMGNLLGYLEMQISVLLDRFSELESGNLSPMVVGAASTIIFTAPHVDSRDLLTCRELIGARLGPHFLHAASTNRDQHVSAQVVQALSAHPASAADMHDYLAGIARSYNIQWTPEYRPRDVIGALSEILDKSSETPTVDMSHLSKLCAYGIPDSPSWLRPRIWRLLLGTLPALKASWETEARKHREDYYDLVRRLLGPFSSLPPPTSPPAPLDVALTSAIKDLFRVPPGLFSRLEEEPDSVEDCPLDPDANEKIKISCSVNLDIRLKAINQGSDDPQDLPEIRFEGEVDLTPEISVTSPGSAPPRTLIPSHSFNTRGVHPKHASALIRLLYIHSCLNPANDSPHMASLLIPLYSVLLQEVESPDVAHVEADTFWLFEAMVGEFAEFEDDEGGSEWMRRFSDRLAWADPELSADLRLKGLDPGLPHYSYRWLAPLLTQTLPLPSLLSVWDSLFACPMATRGSSPKLDALLDVCTSMLIRTRGPLFCLGKAGRHSSGLWVEEDPLLGPPSSLRARELNDAFIEGMSLLQMYPLESAGGIDSILQTAVELRKRREELRAANANTLGSRLRDTIWKGFTNQSASLQSSSDTSGSSGEESQVEGDKTETHPSDVASSTPSLTSKLANAFWQGITNQSAMEVPSSPVSPLSSPSASPPSSVSPLPPSPSGSPLPPVAPQPPTSSVSSPTSSLWSYAEKLKDSDAAASFAKASTNWRVKAMQAWNNRTSTATSPSPDPSSSQVGRETDSAGRKSSQEVANAHRGGSLSNAFRNEAYSPPPRPAYFRPPRDSMLPQPRSRLSSPPPSDSGDDTASTQAKGLRDSITSLTGLVTATSAKPSPLSGPRPLLLSSSPLLTKSTPPTPSRTPPMRFKNDSVSSIINPASVITRKTRYDSQSERESDATESRVVPLNRHSVSPMAPQFRLGSHRPQSSSSEKIVSGQDLISSRGLNSPSAHSEGSASRGWSRVDVPDSPLASPPLHTPPPPIAALIPPAVSSGDSQRGSVVISESSIRVLEAPNQARKVVRKKTPPPSRVNYTSDSAPDALPRSPRLRSKRAPQQLTKLHIQKAGEPEGSTGPDTLALPVFPDDHDTTVTPRASDFHEFNGENSASSASSTSPVPSPYRTRKLSSESRNANGDTLEPRTRQISSNIHSPKARKVSEGRLVKHTESGAEEGDDEGYDELLRHTRVRTASCIV